MKIRIIPCDKGAFQPIEVSHAESVHIIGSHIVYELKTTNSERQSINLIISHPFAVDVTEDTQPDETKRETMAHTRKETQVMTVEMDETNGGRHSKVGMNFMAIGPEALARMALVLEQGAVAHNDPDGTNWRKIPCEVHLNHLLYHVNAWMRGVVGEDHLGHALCRAMMACETEGGGQWRS